MPEDILIQLRQSSKAYDDVAENISQQALSDAIAKTAETEAVAAKQLADAAEKAQCSAAAEKARARVIEMETCFPLLSKIVESIDNITLENAAINEWSDSAIFELNQLYSCYGQKVVCVDTTHNLVSVPSASSRKSFTELALKTNWIESAAKQSAGRGMDLKDSAALMVECLRPMFESDVSASELSENDVTVCVSLNIIYIKAMHFCTHLSLF